MFYYYFRVFNWLCNIFGMKKPFLLPTGQPCNITYWNKLWSVTIIAIFITVDSISINVISEEGIKKNLQNISATNDLVFSIIIIMLDFSHGSKAWSELYETFDSIFTRLMLSNKNLKMISFKLYVWFALPTAIFVMAIFVEVLYPPQSSQFVLLIKFPSYLVTLHLVVHLYLVVAVLNLINNKLTNTMPSYTRDLETRFYTKQTSTFKYIFDTNINFMSIDQSKHDFSLILLCKVYDDLSTCIQLLEKLHGKQILCTIWIMFSGPVVGAALINSEETNHTWLIITRSLFPFSWFSLCCLVDDQLRKEVVWTEILIMKHLIDFKCDPPRKKVLETFKQLVSTSSLQFTAGNLFHVNYSMILGTVMNAITYSIILVQLFLSHD